MNKNRIAIILGIVCTILTIAIVIQVNTIKRTSSTVSGSSSELKDEVLKWKEKYDNATIDLENAQKELANIRESSSQNDETASAKEKEIKLNNNLLGFTNLEGKGIELTVKDDPNAKRENLEPFEDISEHIVHDGDLRSIVNELKNAGAEAISINDQRIVTTTAITCIGNVIKVNDEKVSSPFVIKAIGFPESLESALNRGGGYLELLNEKGIETPIKKLNKVQINKYNGAINSKYMKNSQ